jgi:uncharacterized protein
MNKTNVISRVEGFARQSIVSYDSGHDWWHLQRVRGLALHLQKVEGGDPLLIEIAALLHDVDDTKFDGKMDLNTGDRITRLLKEIDIEDKIINEVIFINKNISFSKGAKPQNISPEFMIVQDADRLDAIGAIGVARAFNYGGFRNNPIYDPSGERATTVGHFYDKLLKLKELMNTNEGRKLADERHKYLESFLKEFFSEWTFVIR